ncbi:MAG TPA: xanthine dehydrogenase family protein molybdopterin-binding subunit [Phycisphaerae bacterium]|nr:xanthine dehydrogenase family protein molybdopterin-binding subunit [Phycisphaerae bacterium]
MVLAYPWVGPGMDRVDGRAKVTGAAKYTADFLAGAQGRGTLQAVLVGSAIARGRVVEIDAGEAWRMPGVASILTHENMPRLGKLDADDEQGTPGQVRLPLQTAEVEHVGEYVAMVIAETLERAEAAAARIRIRYEEKQGWTWNAEAGEVTGREYRPKEVGRGDEADSERGDGPGAVAAAAVQVRERYLMGQENHNPMEMSATVAAWEQVGGEERLTVYSATQHVYGCRHVIARALGLEDRQVRVICPFVGGAFGCKGSTWPHEYLAAAAAKVVGRPVKVVLSRRQMFTGCGCRPELLQRVSLGAEPGGRLAGMVHDAVNHTAASDEWAEPAAVQTRMIYSCANVKTTHRLVPVHRNNPTQMRAPGHAPGTWALEAAMDELAWKAGIDPIELRLRNDAERDEELDKPWSSKSLRECYRAAAERFGWERYQQRVGAMREGRTLIGWGMATALYPTNREGAHARVKLLPDGTAVVISATHDLGTGTYTIMTQVAAEALGLPVESVVFLLGDTDMPESPVAGGSQSAASVGTAVRTTCEAARRKLFEEAHAGDGETTEQVLRRHGKVVEAEGKAGPPEKQSHSAYAFGAQFAEVRIDAALREVRVSRAVGAFAAGRILNEKTARSQLMGGMVMGVGMALMEHTAYDRRRLKVVTDNLADYLVPVNPDVPAVEVILVPEEDRQVNEIGAKGIGELGTTGIAAAITNAIYHATGVRVRELPATLDKIM